MWALCCGACACSTLEEGLMSASCATGDVPEVTERQAVAGAVEKRLDSLDEFFIAAVAAFEQGAREKGDAELAGVRSLLEESFAIPHVLHQALCRCCFSSLPCTNLLHVRAGRAAGSDTAGGVDASHGKAASRAAPPGHPAAPALQVFFLVTFQATFHQYGADPAELTHAAPSVWMR